METRPTIDDLFERRIIYPDPDSRERFNHLIGLDEQKSRLSKMLGLLVNPNGLEVWMSKYHPNASQLKNISRRRPPLVILAGDVGSGKTELAETIGDSVARQENIGVTLFPLSLSARGQGLVGEMTRLLSAAFEYTYAEAKKLKSESGSSRGAVILLVDEADALTQSRETAQMHHEDRAGVNAFIRGIDKLANGRLPAAVIMCTNRLGALDPAVKRRAAEILEFSRPNIKQRAFVLKTPLQELGFSDEAIKAIAKATGSTDERDYGFTYSDLMQRYLPNIVLDAYPDQPVTAERAIEIAKNTKPTPPFQDNEET